MCMICSLLTLATYACAQHFYSHISLFFLHFVFRLSLSFRGFNDAVNGFNDDGWSIMSCDGAEDVIISVNSTKSLCATSTHSNSLSLLGGILCAKASMLLQVSSETIIICLLLRPLFA